MEKLVYGICEDEQCGREVHEPNRKFCWRCLSLRTRTGHTYTGAMELRREKGKVCELCNQYKRVMADFNEKKVCIECFRILTKLSITKGLYERIPRFLKKSEADE